MGWSVYIRNAVLLHLLALLLLITGGLLEVAGIAFWGLDTLIGLCFAGALVASGVSALVGRTSIWGLAVAGLAALALCVHLWLVFVA
jgi:hypothetical protein